MVAFQKQVFCGQFDANFSGAQKIGHSKNAVLTTLGNGAI
jgi:hypothetical protein